MKRITSIEIQALKGILSIYRDENIMLRMENDELRKQLEESRAKEGKGALESIPNKHGSWWLIDIADKPVAWMPWPEPYIPEKEENENAL